MPKIPHRNIEIRNKTIKEMVDEIPTTFYVKGFSIVEEIGMGDFNFKYNNCCAEPTREIRFKVLLHSLNCQSGVWYFKSYEQAKEFVKLYCKKHDIKLGDFKDE